MDELGKLMKIIKENKMSKDDVLSEAECVEDYGEWIHMSLIGYSADELRKAANMM